jgi:hypothetical protein
MTDVLAGGMPKHVRTMPPRVVSVLARFLTEALVIVARVQQHSIAQRNHWKHRVELRVVDRRVDERRVAAMLAARFDRRSE